MKELIKMISSADKYSDLMYRSFAVYPIKQDKLELAKRHANNDPNVVAYFDENGTIDYYGLVFTSEQTQELRQAFTAALGGGMHEECREDKRDKWFVGVLEEWGAAIPEMMSCLPRLNKDRARAIESFANAVEKMDAVLADLDSGGLGWLYANVADKLSEIGVRVSPEDEKVVSMQNHPIQAMVEAGELRQQLRSLASAVVSAAADAKKNLPIIDRVEIDPRFTTAKALERLIIENELEFSTSETGFPAQCLRAMFELGGLEVEKVSYWLKKVADDPDSFAKFRQRMQEKSEGENPTSL